MLDCSSSERAWPIYSTGFVCLLSESGITLSTCDGDRLPRSIIRSGFCLLGALPSILLRDAAHIPPRPLLTFIYMYHPLRPIIIFLDGIGRKISAIAQSVRVKLQSFLMYRTAGLLFRSRRSSCFKALSLRAVGLLSRSWATAVSSIDHVLSVNLENNSRLISTWTRYIEGRLSILNEGGRKLT